MQAIRSSSSELHGATFQDIKLNATKDPHARRGSRLHTLLIPDGSHASAALVHSGGPMNSTLLLLLLSRGRAVGIPTGYGMEDRGVGVRVPVG
jgi:hypothetical protein